MGYQRGFNLYPSPRCEHGWCGPDGGAADGHGGLNTGTISDSFTITIRAVNDKPSFVKGDNQNVADNAGPQEVRNIAAGEGWATQISTGPSNESTQSLSFDLSQISAVAADGETTIPPSDLFTATGYPAVHPDTGDLTYTPKNGAKGKAVITVKKKNQ